MSTPQVIHHTDYRSKAEDRRRELEKLQAKGLAKTQAAQLRDAPIPTEACNFLKKQRQLFQQRRKHQADAIEFLHQFRADDDFVLRSTRRSLGSRKDNYAIKPRTPNRYEQLEPGRQPDARAAVYSHAVYPTMRQTKEQSTVEQDDISNKSPLSQSPNNRPDIIKDSISFNDVFQALELAAKEAARCPLPEDSDFDNTNYPDNYQLKSVTDTLTDLEERTNEPPLYGNATQLSHSGEKEETCERFDPILIVEGEIDDDIPLLKQSDIDDAGDSSTTPFIPFEAFSKLGESLVMESQLMMPPSKTQDVVVPLAKSDSDDESIIPGLSFMQLGASIMANDLSSSSKDDADKDSFISPVKESEESTMTNSDTMSKTETDATISQISIGCKSLTADAPIVKPKVGDDEQKERQFKRIVVDTDAMPVVDLFESIETPKRSNRNIIGSGDDEIDFIDQISGKRETVEEEESIEKIVELDREDENGADRVSKKSEMIEGSNIPDHTEVIENKDANFVDKITEASETVEKGETAEIALELNKEWADEASEEERVEDNGHKAVGGNGILENRFEHGIQCENLLDLSVDKELTVEEGAIPLTAVGNACENINSVEGVRDQEERVEENQVKPKADSAVTNADSIAGDVHRNPRRNGARKKKKKDKSYYPSSSLFVSRQFLSR